MKDFEPAGILLIDKPGGPTSHDVVAAVRKLVRPLRVGHTGTLDPMATGLLILCVGKATRVSEILQAEYKVYRAAVLLGLKTDTQDIEGAVLQRQAVGEIPIERIHEVARSFTGWIEQRPPVFSAAKVNGVRAYRLARRGQDVSLGPRRVEIRKLVIEDVRLPVIEFIVECSKGTYVRALCNDLGDALGVGGCMESLRRLEIGRFSVADAIEPSRLNERRDVIDALLPLSQALSHLHRITVDEEQAEHLLHGMRAPVGERVPTENEESSWVCAYDLDGRLLALGTVVSEGGHAFFRPRKLLAPLE
jgi:tRNA pseudouridine55 synthase